MTTSWIWWLLFMGICLVFPMGFGWGYRGWGPPYPRYVQRRRHARASAAGTLGTFDHHAWGVGGDLVWLGLLTAALWAVAFAWWR